PVLRRLRWEAMFEYGMLARNIGGLLGNKWLPRRENQPDVLEVPDFSTTTDIYSVVANIYNIDYVPVSFKTVRDLLIFIALPFVAVLLIAQPAKAILDSLVKLVVSCRPRYHLRARSAGRDRARTLIRSPRFLARVIHQFDIWNKLEGNPDRPGFRVRL